MTVSTRGGLLQPQRTGRQFTVGQVASHELESHGAYQMHTGHLESPVHRGISLRLPPFLLDRRAWDFPPRNLSLLRRLPSWRRVPLAQMLTLVLLSLLATFGLFALTGSHLNAAHLHARRGTRAASIRMHLTLEEDALSQVNSPNALKPQPLNHTLAPYLDQDEHSRVTPPHRA